MLDLKALGKQIREVRLMKNFSMEEIAQKANITRATLAEIENGNPRCAIGSYINVMSILEIDLLLSSKTKSKKRKRATRKILKSDKKINHWVVFTIELYAQHIDKSSDTVYKKLEKTGLIDMLYKDYEDLHGMSPEYINDFLDGCLKGEKL